MHQWFYLIRSIRRNGLSFEKKTGIRGHNWIDYEQVWAEEDICIFDDSKLSLERLGERIIIIKEDRLTDSQHTSGFPAT